MAGESGRSRKRDCRCDESRRGVVVLDGLGSGTVCRRVQLAFVVAAVADAQPSSSRLAKASPAYRSAPRIAWAYTERVTAGDWPRRAATAVTGTPASRAWLAAASDGGHGARSRPCARRELRLPRRSGASVGSASARRVAASRRRHREPNPSERSVSRGTRRGGRSSRGQW